MKESAGAIADSIREVALTDGTIRFECTGCSLTAHITLPEELVVLVDHAVFDHTSRHGIISVQIKQAIDPYELAMRRGAAPQNQWEQLYREEQARERASAHA